MFIDYLVYELFEFMAVHKQPMFINLVDIS